MSGKRRGGKKTESDEAGLSKEQDAVARYLRFNCPTNTTMFEGNEVHYFSGNKAIDTLMNSKYGEQAKGDPLFPNRTAAIAYVKEFLDHQLFFRARKLVPKKKDGDKEKEKKITGSATSTPKPAVNSKKLNKKEEETETEAEEKKEDKDSDKKEEKDKKKKKVKLEVHNVQVFNDDKDVYVWIFDPTPLFKKIIGLLMVVGTIVGCLFPLWPMWLRQGVYYLSLAGIGAFGLIVVVAILRTILFGIIWLATMGQHKLWILPNLTEDCGFFESFKPWYTYEYCPRGSKPAAKEDKKKEKDSDDEEAKDDVKQENVEEKENSAAEENSASEHSDSEQASSVPPSPEEGAVKRRRPRKDDGFVVVQ